MSMQDGRVREGRDLGAIEQVFRDEHHRLWRALVLWSGKPDVASDAVAEAFAQLIARGDGVRDQSAWVWRAAFKIAGGELAQRRPDAMPVQDPAANDTDDLVDVIRALGRLSAHQRASVVLADYAGYPHAEVARILGSTTSAVAVHIYRGRRRLRTLLEVGDD
jgi:RNA polymerase sigma-70 factor (ECF subfamily)